jgi:hypothetical protein
MALVGVPRIVQLVVDPGSFDVLGGVALVGSLVAGMWGILAHLDVDDEGIALRPGTLTVAWDEIESFEARPRRDFVRIIRVHRKGKRPRTLTPGWMKPERSGPVLDELEKRLSASRTG